MSPQYTELSARTAFILDRKKFLNDIINMMQGDEEASDCKALLTVLLENDYIPLVARLMGDADQETRDFASWAMGNLVGADTKTVADAATAAAMEQLTTIFENMRSSLNPLQRAASFLLCNLNRLTESLEIRDHVMGLLENEELRDFPKGTRMDLLAILSHNVDRTHYNYRSLNSLINLYTEASNDELLHLLRILGDVTANQAIHPEQYELVYDLVEGLLYGDKHEKKFKTILWLLSNVVADGGAADVFVEHGLLFDRVCELAVATGRPVARYNALFCLANCIACIRSDDKKEWLRRSEEFRGAFGDTQMNRNNFQSTLDLLGEFDRAAAPPAAEDDSTDSDSDSMPDLIDASGNVVYDDEKPCERSGLYHNGCWCNETQQAPALATSAPILLGPVPSAIDLCMGGSRNNLSPTVRYLVGFVVNATEKWTALPPDTLLTVRDLYALEALGYMVSRGYIGVNPYLTASWC
jgi:hypothetical protein